LPFEQVERRDVDQLRCALERCEHIGRKAGRRVALARNALANVAFGVD
jgi:hypothetical protein